MTFTMYPIIIKKNHCRHPNSSTSRRFVIATGAALLLLAGAASSCRNTIKGVGRDVENTGDHIENVVR